MRTFLEITRFELGYHLRSPFFLAALFVFGLIHLLTATRTGINLALSDQANLNSVYAIMGVELTLSLFGMLPIVAFVTTGMTRDHQHATASLLYTTPVPKRSFVLGRCAGALGAVLLIALMGLFGSLIGPFIPWVDPERLTPFSMAPYLWRLVLIVVPNGKTLSAGASRTLSALPEAL